MAEWDALKGGEHAQGGKKPKRREKKKRHKEKRQEHRHRRTVPPRAGTFMRPGTIERPVEGATCRSSHLEAETAHPHALVSGRAAIHYIAVLNLNDSDALFPASLLWIEPLDEELAKAKDGFRSGSPEDRDFLRVPT
ncbi:hypothetical protein PG991_003570 [Apiospora marii]|uniref:Uncharacterized protein n=1 Tax=Apiospora marii TaxID=335849 RepID=A0ABR1S3W2_9PEZI